MSMSKLVTSEDLGLEHYHRCDEDGDHTDDCCAEAECEDVEPEPPCPGGDDHDWTREGTGGCDENPGVWSLGGTAYAFAARCTLCGMGRHERHCGSQRNPYECDSVRYEREEYEHLVERPDLVVVEEIPDWLRESYRAARNWGVYPLNGASRRRVTREEAEEIVAADEDGYAHFVEEAR